MAARKQIVVENEDLMKIYPYSQTPLSLKRDKRIFLESTQHTDQQFEVTVTNNDCIEDALSESQNGQKVLLINSASAIHPGGGYLRGRMAQEEAICYRSNLYDCLKKFEYPLYDKLKGIYSPKVTFFRDADHQEVDPWQLDILSVFSAPRSKISGEKADEINRNIFDTIFYFLQKQNPEVLVMVPVGCGVFQHDPHQIAKMMAHYLNHYQLNSNLKKIIVSCYDNEPNFSAFSYYLDS